MKRVIIAVEKLISDKCLIDREMLFCKALHERLGFEIIYTNSGCSLPHDAEIILTDEWTAKRYQELMRLPAMKDLISRKKNIRHISIFTEVHGGGAEFEERMRGVFENTDVILSGSWELFESKWPEYMNKHEFFPLYFASYERYAGLGLNSGPTMKCLVCGARGKVYTLRRYLMTVGKNGSRLIDVLPHPGFTIENRSGECIDDNFARKLNEYYCCATDSSNYHYAVAKYFEIPAAGSLLLAEDVADARRAGLMPWKHFVPIDRATALSRIEDCLEHPDRYNGIRDAGTEFVRRNHSILNRVGTVEKIIGRYN